MLFLILPRACNFEIITTTWKKAKIIPHQLFLKKFRKLEVSNVFVVCVRLMIDTVEVLYTRECIYPPATICQTRNEEETLL